MLCFSLLEPYLNKGYIQYVVLVINVHDNNVNKDYSGHYEIKIVTKR